MGFQTEQNRRILWLHMTRGQIQMVIRVLGNWVWFVSNGVNRHIWFGATYDDSRYLGLICCDEMPWKMRFVLLVICSYGLSIHCIYMLLRTRSKIYAESKCDETCVWLHYVAPTHNTTAATRRRQQDARKPLN